MKITASQLKSALDSLPDPKKWKGYSIYRVPILNVQIEVLANKSIYPPRKTPNDDEGLEFILTNTPRGMEWVLDV